MGKDDYFLMSIFGKTPEERRIATKISDLIDDQAKSDGEIKSYEVIISAFPKKEMFNLRKEQLDLMTPFWEALSDWEIKKPKPIKKDTKDMSQEDWKKQSAWYYKRFEEVSPIYKINLDNSENIDDSLDTEKQKIFDDLASRLQSLMINLRSNSLLEIGLKNYDIMDNILKENPEINNQITNNGLKKIS